MSCRDLIPGEKRTADRSLKCCVCGHWITRMEYGGMITGKYIDYIDKSCGDVTLTLCSECMEKVMTYVGDDNYEEYY